MHKMQEKASRILPSKEKCQPRSDQIRPFFTAPRGLTGTSQASEEWWSQRAFACSCLSTAPTQNCLSGYNHSSRSSLSFKPGGLRWASSTKKKMQEGDKPLIQTTLFLRYRKWDMLLLFVITEGLQHSCSHRLLSWCHLIVRWQEKEHLISFWGKSNKKHQHS